MEEFCSPCTAAPSISATHHWNDDCLRILVNNLSSDGTAVVTIQSDTAYSTTDMSAIEDTFNSASKPCAKPIVKKSQQKCKSISKDMCKKARNSGRMYFKLRGKDKGSIVEGKTIGPDCKCPNQCFEKIGKETVQKIFRDFWALADYNSQNAYLFGFISTTNVKRRYTKNVNSRRNITVSYSVKCHGENTKVCKKAFLHIHGLQKSRGRINNLVLKMKAGESVPSSDQRGRHNNRPYAYGPEEIDHVHCHLQLMSKPRKKNKRLGRLLDETIRKCYSTYVDEYCKLHGISAVSFDKYRRIAWNGGFRFHKEVVKPLTSNAASQTV